MKLLLGFSSLSQLVKIAKHPPDSFLRRRQYCGMGRDPYGAQGTKLITEKLTPVQYAPGQNCGRQCL
eukprot:scaffold5642_cov86-Skeletonema_marinoi.AAC.2